MALPIIFTLAALTLVACGGSAQTPTATLAAVPSATPSSTPEPMPNATPAASVTVSPQSAIVAIGQSRQLTATLKDAIGNVLTGLTITWSSSNPSIVTVSTTGLATGIAPGSATITVNSGTVIVTVSITVGEITAASVSLTPQSPALARGQSQQLTATITDANGSVLPGLTVTWSSSNPSSATVLAAGLVTGIAAGYATITATAEGKTGTALITVTDATVTSVTVRPQSATVAIGQSRQFVATISDANGNVLTGLTAIWSSSNQSAATVSAAGLVTVAGPGSATITATAEGKTGTALITVTDATVASVTVSPQSATVAIGQSRQLIATISDTNGTVLTGLIATWSSPNSSVATVSAAGVVSGIDSGSATITATAEGKTGTALITVSNIPVASVTVSPQSTTLITGQTQQLVATLKDANGNVLTGLTVTWSSSNPSAATVSDTGLVTGIAPGSATIIATTDGQTGASLITVSDAPVASVTVGEGIVVLVVGQTRQLVATLKDANGNVLSGRTVTWSSSDSSDVTVSTTGLVTGQMASSATITATAEGISGTTSVEIVLL